MPKKNLVLKPTKSKAKRMGKRMTGKKPMTKKALPGQ